MFKPLLWFVKITGILPASIFARRKTYYLNKQQQSRKIKGKAIIVSNHTDVFDYAFYMFLFLFRDIYVLVAEVIQVNSFMKHFTSMIGGIFTNRNLHDYAFFDVLKSKLQKNKVILFFPDGKINKEFLDFPYKDAFVRLALLTSAPIIPLYTTGEYFDIKKRSCVLIGEKSYPCEMYNNNLDYETNVSNITLYYKNYIGMLRTTLHTLLDAKTKK